MKISTTMQTNPKASQATGLPRQNLSPSSQRRYVKHQQTFFFVNCGTKKNNQKPKPSVEDRNRSRILFGFFLKLGKVETLTCSCPWRGAQSLIQ